MNEGDYAGLSAFQFKYINVTVNGVTKKINGNRDYAWGGADAEIANIQDASGELNVSISMENVSSDFTIRGIGVVK